MVSAAAPSRRPRPQLTGFVALSDSQMHALQTSVTRFPTSRPLTTTIGKCGISVDERHTEPFDVFRVVPGHKLCIECVHAIEEEISGEPR